MPKTLLQILYQVALQLLSAPGSSAPNERVFSHWGIVMKTRLALLIEATLSRQVFESEIGV